MTVPSRHFIWPLMVVVTAGNSAFSQHAPDDAWLAGSKLPYYGSVDPWDRRFFYDHIQGEAFRPGRVGQRQMLDIVENRPLEAIAYCRQRLEDNPHELESLFTLTIAWCRLDETQQALTTMNRALDAGLPFARFLAGPRDLLKPLTETPEFRQLAAREEIQLIHGPLLGCLTDSSARFWVRTLDELPVQIVVSTSHDLSRPIESSVIASDADRDFTAVVEVTGLQAGTEYFHDVVVDGETNLGPHFPTFRTYPPPGTHGRFHVAFGGGASFVPDHERMWNTISAHDPSAFLFMGDNVYIDLPQQPNGFHRYTYYRRQSVPEYRRFVASTAIFAIWDDHDCAMDDLFFGPHIDKPAWKRPSWQLFRDNWNNPGYGDGEERPGC